MKARWIPLFSFLTLLLTYTPSPVHAAQSDARSLELTLHAGSAELRVDGMTTTIAAPYLAKDSTMIPISVFTRVLGAELKLKNNDTITLILHPYNVVVTLGSKSAVVNGQTVTLAAAPAVKNGYTYVPVRLLELFGGEISYDATTREISVSVLASAAAGKTGSAIDSDAGKTGIGDSHYQWTMNYPAGLIQEYQSDSGDSLIFRDLKLEYYLGIFVETTSDPLTSDDRRNRLYEYVEGDETIVDKQTITGPDYTYDRITTKDRTGFYYEMRGLQSNDIFYVVIYGKKAASIAELRQHNGILDSFKPVFDPNNPAIKNLAKLQDALAKFNSDDYGLTLELPQSWTGGEGIGTPYFSSPEDDAYLWMKISSLVPGDTVDDWIKRSNKRFEAVFASDYMKEPEISKTRWNGIPAQLVKLSYSLDTVNWWEEYEIYAVQGSYRYYTEFAYLADPDSEMDYDAWLKDILDSMKVDFKAVESRFGEIPDETDMLDMEQTTRKTNRTYGYSITVPSFWSVPVSSMESDQATFTFLGGSLNVMIIEDFPDPRTAIDGVRENYLDEFEDEDDVTILEDAQTMYAGQSALKLVVEDARNVDRVPSRDTTFLFEHDGHVYIVQGTYGLANGTEFVRTQMEAAIRSFQLIE